MTTIKKSPWLPRLEGGGFTLISAMLEVTMLFWNVGLPLIHYTILGWWDMPILTSPDTDMVRELTRGEMEIFCPDCGDCVQWEGVRWISQYILLAILYLPRVWKIFTPQCNSLNIHPPSIWLQYKFHTVVCKFTPL